MMTQQEIEQHARNYNEHIKRLNAMSEAEIDKLIKEDNCPYEPQHLLGTALGMFHCPICGEMVVAGVPHGKSKLTPEQEAELDRMAENATPEVPINPMI